MSTIRQMILVIKEYLLTYWRKVKSIKRPLIFVFGVLLVVGISVYFIYNIPNESLQNIVLTIVAAVFGGIFTLMGVSWTIRKGDAVRRADLRRIENERKEEERKKNIPYARLANEYQPMFAARIEKVGGINFNNSNDIERIKKGTYYLILFNHFVIKNISQYPIILKGIYIVDNYYLFVDEMLVEHNEVCQIQIGFNNWFAFADKVMSIHLLISDTLNNSYDVTCKLYLRMDQEPQKNCAPNGMEYLVCAYVATVESISLPRFLED